MITPLEETYPYILEEILNKNNVQIYFEVLNAGCGGYSSFQGLRFLKSELLEYGPDLLIVWFGINDIEESILYSDKEQKFPSEIFTKLNKILNHSKFYQFYRQGLFFLLSKFTKNKRRISAEDYCENLRKMSQLAKEKGISIMFITPVWNINSTIASLEEQGLEGYAKIFKDFLKEDVSVLDMANIFKQKRYGAKYFIDMCHMIPEGNRIIAEAVYDLLIKEKIIPIIHNVGEKIKKAY